MRRAASLVLACALASGGCGLFVDVGYLVDGKRFTTHHAERNPTGQTITTVAYEAAIDADGELRLRCEERTSPLERAWEVTKTWEYQGGREERAYRNAAISSAFVAAVLSGALLVMCHQDDTDLSCWNIAYAAPFALDAGWAALRAATADPPKLVDKQSGSASFAVGEPIARTPQDCSSVAGVALGRLEGPPHDPLNGDGTAPSQRLEESLSVALAADGAIALASEAAAVVAWVERPALALVVVDRGGAAHPLRVDRCAVLRPLVAPLAARIEQDALQRFERACPPPELPGTP